VILVLVVLLVLAHLVQAANVRREQARCLETSPGTFRCGLALLALDGFVITMLALRAGW